MALTDSNDMQQVVKKICQQFANSLTNGDVKTFELIHRPDAIILDEFPPHIWTGRNSTLYFWNDFRSQVAQISDLKLETSEPIACRSANDICYAVAPLTISYSRLTEPVKYEGTLTFVLERNSDSWKIKSWTYARSSAFSI